VIRWGSGWRCGLSFEDSGAEGRIRKKLESMTQRGANNSSAVRIRGEGREGESESCEPQEERRWASFYLSGRVRRFQGASGTETRRNVSCPRDKQENLTSTTPTNLTVPILTLFLIARIKLQLHSKPNMSIQPAISFDISIDGKVS
jgi:hypothetical protein